MTVLLNEAMPVQQVYTEPQQVAMGLKEGKQSVSRKTRNASRAVTRQK